MRAAAHRAIRKPCASPSDPLLRQQRGRGDIGFPLPGPFAVLAEHQAQAGGDQPVEGRGDIEERPAYGVSSLSGPLRVVRTRVAHPEGNAPGRRGKTTALPPCHAPSPTRKRVLSEPEDSMLVWWCQARKPQGVSLLAGERSEHESLPRQAEAQPAMLVGASTGQAPPRQR